MVEEKVVAAFKRDGAVLLKGAFASWVDDLRDGIEFVIKNPSSMERSYCQDGSRKFFQDMHNWRRVPSFKRFIFESQVAPLAAQLMVSKTARFFFDHVLVKEPGSSVPTPWHQDAPVWFVGGRQNVSFWIPVDPIPKGMGLECVAGSHLWDVAYKARRFDGTSLYANSSLPDLPAPEILKENYEILVWEMEPRDAIAFPFSVVHGASGNTSGALRRRVLSTRWFGDDAVYLDRRASESDGSLVSKHFEYLNFKDGAALNSDEFPLVYSR